MHARMQSASSRARYRWALPGRAAEEAYSGTAEGTGGKGKELNAAGVQAYRKGSCRGDEGDQRGASHCQATRPGRVPTAVENLAVSLENVGIMLKVAEVLRGRVAYLLFRPCKACMARPTIPT